MPCRFNRREIILKTFFASFFQKKEVLPYFTFGSLRRAKPIAAIVRIDASAR